jgi:hypothetical protein
LPKKKKKSKGLNRYFSKEDIQVANIHMKRCSAPLTIKEMQTIIIIRYCFFLTRIAAIKKTCWLGCGETGTCMYCLWECKREQLPWKIWWLLKKLQVEFPYDPTILLLGLYV